MEAGTLAGPRVIGPYVLGPQIGAGGMGAVHLGLDRGAGTVVAIKRLRAEVAGDPDFVAMFRDEARLSMLVRHPHVVATRDVIADAGELFLVMDFVAGASLAAALAAGPAPPAVAARVALDVLAGLAAAHAATDERGAPLELVHRDVSPANVLVGSDGAARLADFGVARAAGRFQATRPGHLKGKLRYLAPETLRGSPATPRSDLYAVAVVLWEALAGARLFPGTSYAQIFGQVLEGIVRPPPQAAPALSAVVRRGLSRDPEARFPTASAMAAALAAALAPAPREVVAAWIDRAAATEMEPRRRAVEALRRGEAGGPAGPGPRQDEETPTAPRGPRFTPRT